METLAALLIMGVLAAGGAQLLGQSVRGTAAVDAAASRTSELAILSALFAGDLSEAVARPGTGTGAGMGAGAGFGDLGALDTGPSAPSALVARSGEQDGLLLALIRGGRAALPGEAPQSPLQRVEYHLRGGALSRTLYAAADPSPDTPRQTRILLNGASSVRLRLRTAPAPGAWASRWPVAAGEAGRLPLAAELTVQRGEGDERDTVRLFHPFGLGGARQ